MRVSIVYIAFERQMNGKGEEIKQPLHQTCNIRKIYKKRSTDVKQRSGKFRKKYNFRVAQAATAEQVAPRIKAAVTPELFRVFKSIRVVKSYTMNVFAAPAEVFPLLCPVREYEWIEPWSCAMVF